MWNMEIVTIVPIVIGVTGEIHNSQKTILAQIGLDFQLYIQLQQSVRLYTFSIVSKTKYKKNHNLSHCVGQKKKKKKIRLMTILLSTKENQ